MSKIPRRSRGGGNPVAGKGQIGCGVKEARNLPNVKVDFYVALLITRFDSPGESPPKIKAYGDSAFGRRRVAIESA